MLIQMLMCLLTRGTFVDADSDALVLAGSELMYFYDSDALMLMLTRS